MQDNWARMRILGGMASLAALAACASTNTEDQTSDMAATETVIPEQGQFGAGQCVDCDANADKRVFFGYDQYTLSDNAKDELRRQAAWLKQNPGTMIRLEGNADERGMREYNIALGARRANAAKTYLVGLGIEPSRITTVSYGKERPLDPSSTEAAWAKNRNATTVLSLTTADS